jgi:hypothetical protein
MKDVLNRGKLSLWKYKWPEITLEINFENFFIHVAPRENT